MILSIDPGKETGCAIVVPRGDTRTQQVYCWRGEPWLGDKFALQRVRVCVIERPQIYTRTKSKADPNDLITLAIQVGAYSYWCTSVLQVPVVFVLPSEWKGQADKSVTLNRIERDYPGSLDKFPKSVRHNIADAIAIGLWYRENKS